jgi:non-ribosomal peptide synthetase component F
MLAKYLQKIVENHPKAIAIVDQSLGEVTYEQLWKLILACATNIQQKLGAERYLGLMADQDGRAIITLIATIILGKTIIPIDPRYTPSLAEEILSPYTEHLVVSSPVKNSRHLNQLTLDSLILQPPNNSVDIEYSSENNDAYILHTSGTTGKPKAVLADQKALLHVALTLKKTYHITHASRVLQFAYLSFDSSLVEIWSTLLSGGTLVIAGSELRSNMYGFLERELSLGSISIVTLPPSIANNLPVDCLSSLDTLVLAGEELPTELANRLLGKPRHLINAYGLQFSTLFHRCLHI